MVTGKNVRERQHALLKRIQTEGAEVAFEACLEICRDPKAPAPAKATASNTLLRAAGMLDRGEREQEKEPHEMTAAEVSEAIERLEQLELSMSKPNEDKDIFE